MTNKGIKTDFRTCPNASKQKTETGSLYAACKLIQDFNNQCPVMTFFISNGMVRKRLLLQDSNCVSQDEFRDDHVIGIETHPLLRHQLMFPWLYYEHPKKQPPQIPYYAIDP